MLPLQDNSGAADGGVVPAGRGVLGGGRLRGHVGVGARQRARLWRRAPLGPGGTADRAARRRLLRTRSAGHGATCNPATTTLTI